MIDPGRTRLVALLSAAGSLAAIGLLLASPWRNDVAQPGPLSTNHAQLTDDCGACHVESADALQGLLHGLTATPVDVAQSKLCLDCHELGPHALVAHGWTPATLSELRAEPLTGVPLGDAGELACATCHQEHRGRTGTLTTLGDARCQTCHRERFDGLDAHPEFTSYPQRTKTNLGFDHVSHVLRHFPEDAERAPAACTSCHELDASGRHMPVRGYQETCAACHDTDVTGTAQVEGAGLAVLSLPALDTLTLDQRGVGIGHWPADAMITEAPLTAFLDLLLSGEEGLRRDLEVVRGLDLLDLSAAEDAELAAVARVAWGVKQLYGEIDRRGHGALLARLDPASRRRELLLGLPEDLFAEALAVWQPRLADELARHAAGEHVPTDATPPAEEPDPARDARHEAWVEAGGWYLSELDFVLRYRPAVHADGFLRAWIELAARRSEPLLAELTAPDAVGRCAKCHAVVETDDGPDVRWYGALGGNGERGLDRFSHVAHFASASDNACAGCHVLERTTEGFTDAFGARELGRFVGSFEPLLRASCQECHHPGGAPEGCLTCHAYHARGGRTRLPGASLEAVR